jgi:low temperature requirement protein LtrA
MNVVRRGDERVSPLELFFDLVFVLAITQCTALMAHEPTAEGVAKALVILGVLWWSWVGYAWLTSVLDPDEGIVRGVIFGAMAALLIVAMCVPEAFGDNGLTFALAYAAVRVAHLSLFFIGSRDDPELRRSTVGLAVSTAVGVGLLVTASFFDGRVQGALWLLALLLDMAGPFVFGSEGWHLVPGHFAERHGLIIIVALGESIVAIGLGAGADVDGGVIVAAILGVGLAAAMWWAYFDVVALVAAQRLIDTPPGREQNELARDSYSYLHFPMVAGIVLVAFGLKTTLAHVGDPLGRVPAAALLGGVALYFAAHLAFRYRNVRSLSVRRLVLVVAVLALIPLAPHVDAWVTVLCVTVAAWCLIAYERVRYAAARQQIRHRVGEPG